MKTVEKVITRVEQEQFGYWDPEKEEFVLVDIERADELAAAAEALGCSEQMLDTLGILFDLLKEAVAEDLTDIWKRM